MLSTTKWAYSLLVSLNPSATSAQPCTTITSNICSASHCTSLLMLLALWNWGIGWNHQDVSLKHRMNALQRHLPAPLAGAPRSSSVTCWEKTPGGGACVYMCLHKKHQDLCMARARSLNNANQSPTVQPPSHRPHRLTLPSHFLPQQHTVTKLRSRDSKAHTLSAKSSRSFRPHPISPMASAIGLCWSGWGSNVSKRPASSVHSYSTRAWVN